MANINRLLVFAICFCYACPTCKFFSGALGYFYPP